MVLLSWEGFGASCRRFSFGRLVASWEGFGASLVGRLWLDPSFVWMCVHRGARVGALCISCWMHLCVRLRHFGVALRRRHFGMALMLIWTAVGGRLMIWAASVLAVGYVELLMLCSSRLSCCRKTSRPWLWRRRCWVPPFGPGRGRIRSSRHGWTL